MAILHQSNGITLHHGEALSLLTEMPDQSVAGFVADPPYSSGGQFRGDRAQKTSSKYHLHGTEKRYPEFDGDTRDQRSFLAWSTLWLSEAQRVAAPGAVLACFSDWRQIGVMSDAIQAGGWVLRGICPWNKTRGARPQKGYFRAQCEYILHATNGSLGPEQARDGDCLDGFFTVPVDPADKWHQTGKPLSLMLEILRVFQPGGTVVDPFGGGMTTALACQRLGLPCITFERSAEQAQLGLQRLQEDARKTQLLTQVFAHHG